MTVLAMLALPVAVSSSASAAGGPTSVPSEQPGARPRDAANGSQGLSVARNQDGRLEAFCACGQDGLAGVLRHAYQLVPNGGWSQWEDWGSVVPLETPNIVMNKDGRLEIFLRGTSVLHAWQQWPGGPWSKLTLLTNDGLAANPAATVNTDGRLEVFYQPCGTSCGSPTLLLMHTYQLWPGGPWSDPTPLNPTPLAIGTITAFRNANGELEVLSLASEGPVFNARFQRGVWRFSTVPGPPSPLTASPHHQLSIGVNQDGRAEVFASTTTGIFHMWQTAPSGPWSAFTLLTPVTRTLWNSVARNPDGRLEVFLSTDDHSAGTAAHLWQTAPGTGWSEPASLAQSTTDLIAGSPAAVNNADGRVEAFFIGFPVPPAGEKVRFLHAWQQAKNLGPWTNLVPL